MQKIVAMASVSGQFRVQLYLGKMYITSIHVLISFCIKVLFLTPSKEVAGFLDLRLFTTSFNMNAEMRLRSQGLVWNQKS